MPLSSAQRLRFQLPILHTSRHLPLNVILSDILLSYTCHEDILCIATRASRKRDQHPHVALRSGVIRDAEQHLLPLIGRSLQPAQYLR